MVRVAHCQLPRLALRVKSIPGGAPCIGQVLFLIRHTRRLLVYGIYDNCFQVGACIEGVRKIASPKRKRRYGVYWFVLRHN
jgi:hypothetical protein